MSAETPTTHATPTGASTHVNAFHASPPMYAVGVIALILLLVWITRRGGGQSQDAKRIRKAITKGMGGKGSNGVFVKALTGLLALLWRFVSGREISGKAASNAGFLRPGRRPLKVSVRKLSELDSIALPGPSAVEPYAGPRAAVERWRAWSAAHPLPGRLGAVVGHGGAVGVWLGGASHGALRGVSAAGAAGGRSAKAWGTWPYAARALARLTLLAAVFGLWLHRAATLYALLALAVVLAAAAATGPAGLKLWHGRVRGDDEAYGPALWAALRVMLGQDREEYMDQWLHLDADLSKDDAQIRLALPVHFAGTDMEREQADHLVNSRVPGEWVSRWDLMGGTHLATWTHKPKPKPKAVPPAMVSFFDPDIQEAIRACPKGHIVCGKDDRGRIVIRKLDGETGHWAASIGSGGGKSSFLQGIIAQLVVQKSTIVAVDVKMASLSCYENVPGIHLYADPRNVVDMRDAIAWVEQEVQARNYLASKMEFPKLVLFLEEGNEFADVSKKWWTDNKPKEAPASDPVWGDLATIMRLGRHVHANVIGVFQDLRDSATGGNGLQNLFRLYFMGSFRAQQWDRIVGTKPIPDVETKAGRLVLVDGKDHVEIQVPYATPEELREYVLEERRRQGYGPEASGLFGEPPAHSPEVVPVLLRGSRHVTRPEDADSAPQVESDDEAAGDAVTSRPHDASRDAFVPGQRDGSSQAPTSAPNGLVGIYLDPATGRPQVAAPGAATASWRSDATTPAAPAPAEDDVLDVEGEELLTLAEISRRLEERGISISDALMRQHKSRRKSGENAFPTGTEVDGKPRYTMREIVQYYQAEITAQWRNGSQK